MFNEKRVKEFTLSIAGIGISFLFDQEHPDLGVGDIKGKFIKETSADIKFRVHRDSFPETRKEKKIFDSKSTWSLYGSQGKYFFQDCSFEPGEILDKLVVLEPDFRSGDIYVRNNDSSQNLLPDPLGYPLNQALMINLLPHYKGMMFHACGIVDRNHGYLFLGNSSHGKSTISKLWSENQATVLNDDRIIVREKEKELWMYGTPWHGTFGEVSSKGLLIRKIFFLRHGKKNSVAPKEGREAVSMLLTRCFPPLWDKKGMEYTLGLCHLITNKIPCYELNFVPDRTIIDLVRNI